MDDRLQHAFIWIPLVVSALFLIPLVFYLLTLHNALRKCARGSRTIEPAMVWPLLIPLINLIWSFYVVQNLAESLANEFARRGIACPELQPGRALGFGMSTCGCFFFIPLLNFLAYPAYLALWVLYWMKIAAFSKSLDAPQVWAQAPPAAQTPAV